MSEEVRMKETLVKTLMANWYLAKIHFLIFKLSIRQLSFWRLKFLHYIIQADRGFTAEEKGGAVSTRQYTKNHRNGYWKTTRRRLRSAKRRTRITFLQCRGIIKLFIKGVSIEKIVDRTGISRRKIMQVLKVTRQILARGVEPGTGTMSPYAS